MPTHSGYADRTSHLLAVIRNNPCLSGDTRCGRRVLCRPRSAAEMALDSEDVMVNARGTYEQYDVDVEGWNGDGLDEYIPLTFSPKYGRGRRVRTYGSTPEVETFAERGSMGGLGRCFKR